MYFSNYSALTNILENSTECCIIKFSVFSVEKGRRRPQISNIVKLKTLTLKLAKA
jgi:hypothetical protein